MASAPSSSPNSSSGSTAATSTADQATAPATLTDQSHPAPVFKQSAPRNPPFCIATQIKPHWNLLVDPHEPLAMDIEFQDWKKDGRRSNRLGRVAVTNTLGQVILDTFVYYKNEKHLGIEKVLPAEWRGFGVTHEDLKKDNDAQPAERVEGWLVRILTGRPVVLHGGSNDKKAFYIHEDFLFNHPQVVDTQVLYSYEVDNNRQPGLRACAQDVLGKTIQVDNHSPVEDAQTTMELYLLKQPYQRPAMQTAQRGGRGGSRGRGGRGRGGRGGWSRGRGNAGK
ncbi:uncharacterized protein MYCFIDRAFT_77732 [Pseudocercospora fijiensis CIRAD86]|uniref:Exonuclease domain-containing protein n=1 Tax=Pseudocercospora fijiensis (strain CIRAD86) TaxID=383855 RepID=M3AWV6_PSEFD|nr:uncharacterized protein MYCFIDRAFT_77732 [Pseudocercospora fijiensis CIRAD86]EME81952.1 hypothetical protein MYCFIDRAFT_77732 [Pseudocercospora fijiensis CIRAD86]